MGHFCPPDGQRGLFYFTGHGFRGAIGDRPLLQRILQEADESGPAHVFEARVVPQPYLQGHEERPSAQQAHCLRQEIATALYILVKLFS